MVFHPVEIYKFFKKNKIKMIVGTVVLTIVFILFTRLEAQNNIETVTPTDNVTQQENLDEEEFITDALPANFFFSIEYQDGSIYTNNLLVEQYLLGRNILQEASLSTEIKLSELIDQTGNNIRELYNDDTETKMLGVSRNEQSHLFEFYINVGNERDNVELARYFYELIIDSGVPFLGDKNVYVFKEPAVIKLDKEYEVLAEELPELSEENTLMNVIFVIVISLLVLTFILWIISLFSKKIHYSFSYFLNNHDEFMLVDKRLNNTGKLKQILTKPSSLKRYVVLENYQQFQENSFLNTIASSGNNSFTIVHEISEIKNPLEVESLIYIIVEGETSRSWYKEQRKIDDLYNNPTYVIQINKN